MEPNEKSSRLAVGLHRAQSLIAAAINCPQELYQPPNHDDDSRSREKSLQEKLVELFIEENKKLSTNKRLRSTSHLLEKLVRRDNLNTLVLCLYPLEQGYSLMLRGRSGVDSETLRMSYQQTELLDFVDNEELPPMLMDLLDRSSVNMFYSGCVIVEVQDSRDSAPRTKFVILKPSTRSIINDINRLTNDGHSWTQEERLRLESEILVQTSEPLCLDPSPAAACATNYINYQSQKLFSQDLKRTVQKYSQAAVNRKRKMTSESSHSSLQLYDFLSRRSSGSSKHSPTLSHSSLVDSWQQPKLNLTTPKSIDVMKYAKALEIPPLCNNYSLTLVEEYALQIERAFGRIHLTKLTIQQRSSDNIYFGQLYLDRDYHPDSSNGSSCSFMLGSKLNVDKYVRQFTDIFTEEGKRAVKITHHVPGQEPTVTYTQTMQALAAALAAKKSSSLQLASTPSSAAAATPKNIHPTMSFTPASASSTHLAVKRALVSSHLSNGSSSPMPVNSHGSAHHTTTNQLSVSYANPQVTQVTYSGMDSLLVSSLGSHHTNSSLKMKSQPIPQYSKTPDLPSPKQAKKLGLSSSAAFNFTTGQALHSRQSSVPSSISFDHTAFHVSPLEMSPGVKAISYSANQSMQPKAAATPLALVSNHATQQHGGVPPQRMPSFSSSNKRLSMLPSQPAMPTASQYVAKPTAMPPSSFFQFNNEVPGMYTLGSTGLLNLNPHTLGLADPSRYPSLPSASAVNSTNFFNSLPTVSLAASVESYHAQENSKSCSKKSNS